MIQLCPATIVRSPRIEFERKKTFMKKYDKMGENLSFKGFPFTTETTIFTMTNIQ